MAGGAARRHGGGGRVNPQDVQIVAIIVTALATAALACFGWPQARATKTERDARVAHLDAQARYLANLVCRSLRECVKNLDLLRGKANMEWWRAESGRIARVLEVVEANVRELSVYVTQAGRDVGPEVDAFHDGLHEVHELEHTGWGESLEERNARADHAIKRLGECKDGLEKRYGGTVGERPVPLSRSVRSVRTFRAWASLKGGLSAGTLRPVPCRDAKPEKGRPDP